MRVDHVSRDAIRDIKPYTSRVFELDTFRATKSANVQCAYVRKDNNYDLMFHSYQEGDRYIVTITRTSNRGKSPNDK